jgi:hypothetical protein
VARGDFRCGKLYGIDIQFSAKVLIFLDKTIWREQLFNFHDYGCRDTTAKKTSAPRKGYAILQLIRKVYFPSLFFLPPS